MKNALAVILLASVLILSLVSCSSNISASKSSNGEDTSSTTIIQSRSEQSATTQLADTKTTQVKTAYFNYLKDNIDWFVNTTYDEEELLIKHSIAFIDLNNDGIEELIHLHPNNTGANEIYLSVITYNNGLKTLYDQPMCSYAAADNYFCVFLSNDMKMHSVVMKAGKSKIIRYEYEGDKFSTKILSEEKGGDPNNQLNNKFYINGKECSINEFSNYKDSVLGLADTLLIYATFDNYEVKDLSMSYEDACKHVESSFFDIDWKKQYFQVFAHSNNTYQGYLLAYINEDDIPELVAVSETKANQSSLYWVYNGKIYNDNFELNNLFYLEKKNYYLAHKSPFPIKKDEIKKIDKEKSDYIHQGEINTLKGEEYYKWDGKDLGSLSEYNNALNAAINKGETKSIDNLKSSSEIFEKIKDL